MYTYHDIPATINGPKRVCVRDWILFNTIVITPLILDPSKNNIHHFKFCANSYQLLKRQTNQTWKCENCLVIQSFSRMLPNIKHIYLIHTKIHFKIYEIINPFTTHRWQLEQKFHYLDLIKHQLLEKTK